MIKIKSQQFTSKNLEEALEKAQLEFGVEKNEISYKVIQESSKGFLFGIGSKPIIIDAFINENFLVNKIKEFLSEVLIHFDEDIKTNIKVFGKTIVIYLDGDGLGKLIGKHGRTLGALQHLIMIYINRMTDTKVDIKLDIGEYRKKRRRKIEEIAEQAALKVKKQKNEVELAPMFSFERKTVHEYIRKNHPEIKTKSVGLEPYRKVVLISQ
ncbi:Jag N-terminal domain-containing protein [Oceanotoga sp. DSM 15011]|jgi:spoIIIJ-associated protein|uniref:SpoIIIJ-associated protein n=1 Tax=Oceanotoga teriensis TaxID=515440 RepID=A0AA45C8G1_9BACT|nr:MULTISPECIES: RNA-binding cell elongation regulator Jag/EloR [Oceanotoga]MDN5341201.1 spoIIIJ-associated protein [Oceanotoga sp.]MDO7976883.1 Jag N-terminal domain-containing protein [Oceanotoga teriensis]PWJ95963.1 spoIIIJ-associated protein [Oceanotoga teriensis]UYP00814.1 Jag N-terminal domain-containing protein [Oceanotoga sp. DSM 15011]